MLRLKTESVSLDTCERESSALLESVGDGLRIWGGYLYAFQPEVFIHSYTLKSRALATC